jgi:hypothetical protein
MQARGSSRMQSATDSGGHAGPLGMTLVPVGCPGPRVDRSRCRLSGHTHLYVMTRRFHLAATTRRG